MQPTSTSGNPQLTPKRHTKLALFCLIAPTALIILSLIVFALANFIASGTNQVDNSELFSNNSLNITGGSEFASPRDESSPTNNSMFRTISNVILFVIGSIAVITWLPGIIIGIVLLVAKK